MKKLLLLLILLGAFVSLTAAQTVLTRWKDSFPSVSAQSPPFLQANPLPLLTVCQSPSTSPQCTLAPTYMANGTPCPPGAQDVPDPNALTAACQPTGDALGNVGAWLTPGTYDIFVTIGTTILGPYTITPGSGGAGGSGVAAPQVAFVNQPAYTPIGLPTNFTTTQFVVQCFDQNLVELTGFSWYLSATTPYVINFTFATIQSGSCTAVGPGISTTPPPPPNQFSVTPALINFGQVALGTTSAPQVITIANNTLSTVTGFGFSLSSVNAFDFIGSGTNTPCPSSIPAGTSCTLQYQFKPSLTTPETATLTFTDSAGTQTVILNGTGFNGASVSETPTSLTFPSTAVGATAGPLVVTFTNTGTVPVVFGASQNLPPNPNDFASSNNCSTLPQGQSCTISVTFGPTAIGTRTSTVSIPSTVPGGPQTIGLTGIGLAPPIWQSVAASPTSPTITIPNTLQLAVTATPSAGGTVNATNQVNYSISGGGSTPFACQVGPSAACANNQATYATAFNTTGTKTTASVVNTAGDLLVCMILTYNSGGSQTESCTDGNADSFSHIGPVLAGGSTRSNDLYYVKSGSSTAQTMSCTVSAGYSQCFFFDLSGIASSSFHDVDFLNGSAIGNVISSATNTTTGSFDALIGFCSDSGAPTGAMTPGNGFTTLSSQSSTPSIAMYQLGVGTAPYSFSARESGNPTSAAICIGSSFKGSGSSSFASINQSGLVTALAAGTATVTAQGSTAAQTNSSLSTGCNVAPGCTVSFSSPQTSGNANIVGLSWPSASGTVTSVTDVAGNTYTAAGAVEQANGASSVIYIAAPILPYSATGGNTVQVLMSGSTTNLGIKIAEYAYPPGSSVQDGSVVNSTGASGPAVGSLTTSNANDTVICNVSPAAGQVTITSAPFTIEVVGAGGSALIDAPAFSAGAVASSSTLTGGGYAQQCVAIKALAASDSVTIAAQSVTNTYYMAPSNASPPGNDGNPGTQAAPFQTFAKSLATLKANCPGANGCVLYLENGTYNSTTAGSLLSMNCGTGGNLVSGSSSAQITIQALNERQAFIRGDGSGDPISGNNCSYVNLIGLHIENGDFSGASGDGYIVSLNNWSNSIISRNALAHNNRFVNSLGLALQYGSSNNTVKENEIYDVSRTALTAFSGSNSNEIARNYCNPRNIGDVAGTTHSDGGIDTCFQAYGSTGNTFENNIAENVGSSGLSSTNTALLNCYDVEPISGGNNATNNVFLGDICGGGSNLSASAIVASHGSGDPGHHVPSGNSFTQFAGYSITAAVAFWSRSAFNTSCTGCTLFQLNTGGAGVQADNNDSGAFGSAAMGMNLTNVSVLSGFRPMSKGVGAFEANGTWSGTWNFTNVFTATTPFTVGAGFTNTNSSTTNPVMGACIVWVPITSPLHAAGLSGADIGADIEYEYSGGSLTATPLWSSAAACKLGQVDCVNVPAAIVPGLSDQAGASFYDVASRLHVNNGCLYRSGFIPAP